MSEKMLRRLFGGDVPRGKRGAVGRDAMNTRVVLVAFAPAARCETADQADRAHNERDLDGMLLPGGVVGTATPRRYPSHQMHGRVACDSQYDDLYERQRWLDREVGSVAGVSYAAGGRVNGGSVTAAAMDRGGGAAARLHRRAW